MKYRIYLDNCCFNRPFDEQQQLRIRLETEAKLFVQENILKNKMDLIWSYILEYENYLNPFEERRSAIDKWRKYSVFYVKETKQIIQIARSLVMKKIKPKDALHLACAIKGNCNFLLTTDDELLLKTKKISHISVINPLEFITKIELL